MYASGQIIWDLDAKLPVRLGDVWNPKSYPNRHTHFIIPTGRFFGEISEYRVYSPSSVADAERKLAANEIAIAPFESQKEALTAPTVDLRVLKSKFALYIDAFEL